MGLASQDIHTYLERLQDDILVFLDGLSGELGGGQVAEGLQGEVAHVGLLVGQVRPQEVAGPHLEARVTAGGKGGGVLRWLL